MNLQSIDRLQHLLERVRVNAKRPRTRTQGLGAYLAYAAVPSGEQAARAPVAPVAVSAPAKDETREAPQARAVGAPALVTEARQPAPESPPFEARATQPSKPEVQPSKFEARPTQPSKPEVQASKLEARATQPSKPEVQASKPQVSPVEPSLPPVSIPADELEEIEISVSPEPPAAESGRKVRAPEISAVEIVAEDLPIEDVSVEELGVEEIPIEIGSELTLEPPDREPESEPPAARVPAAAAASVVPQTYTAPPSLDELTFSEPPPPRSAKSASEIEIEPPPASLAQLVSEESEPPGSIDAALLAATEAQAGPGVSDVPIVTPPPESGPQVAIPPMGAPGLPRATAPTMEQLGDVVELEPPSVIPIELADRKVAEARAPEKVGKGPKDSAHEPDEFAPLASQPSVKVEGREPMQTLVGGFTEEQEQGTGQDARRPEPMHPPVRVTTQGVPFAAEESPTAASSPTTALTPETLLRPALGAESRVVDVVAAAHAFRPSSFLDLLDSSLSLLK